MRRDTRLVAIALGLALLALALWSVAFHLRTEDLASIAKQTEAAQAASERAIMATVTDFAYVSMPDGSTAVLGRAPEEGHDDFAVRVKAVASGESDPAEVFCANFSCPGLGTIRLCSSTQAGLDALVTAWCAQNPTCEGC